MWWHILVITHTKSAFDYVTQFPHGILLHIWTQSLTYKNEKVVNHHDLHLSYEKLCFIVIYVFEIFIKSFLELTQNKWICSLY